MEGNQYKKGLWTVEEDKILIDYINIHGEGHWSRVAKTTGLKRCGKSCRLRWMNYLCPKVKRGDFSEEEEDLIMRLHNLLGNRWALIAGRIPGRTDNQVKNYWNTHLRKKLETRKTKISSSKKYCNLNASSLRFTKEVEAEGGDPKHPRVPVPGMMSVNGDGGKAISQVRESSIKASEQLDEMKNNRYLSSSWFSSDISCLKSPLSMDFQDASLLGNMEVWYDHNYWF